MRKIKRRPVVLEPGIQMTTFDTGGRGSRVENLPPYGEYYPNRVHVARRRRAHKDNNSFPRGWTFELDPNITITIPIASGSSATVTKTSNDTFIIYGEDIS